MTTVVINECFGGFSLSAAAVARLKELGVEDAKTYSDVDRDLPALVQTVRELGHAASGGAAQLVAVEIPDGIDWHVHEYDGFESVHEEHRTWGSGGIEDGC